MTVPTTSPLTATQLVDEYFIENRNRLLELAAFLDRIDRADRRIAASDFRMQVFQEGVAALSGGAPNRLEHIQMLLSDPAHPRSVLQGLAEFREHLGGRLTVMLLRSIGQAFDVHEVDTGVMIRSIETLKQIEASGSSRAAGDRVAASLPRGVS